MMMPKSIYIYSRKNFTSFLHTTMFSSLSNISDTDTEMLKQQYKEM